MTPSVPIASAITVTLAGGVAAAAGGALDGVNTQDNVSTPCCPSLPLLPQPSVAM